MFLSEPPVDDDVRALRLKAESDDGYVMNFVRLWAWRPDVHLAFTEARQLLASTTLLSARELAVLNSVTAARIGDSYCSIAWGAKLADLSDAGTAAALLHGDDDPALTKRERALITWAAAVIEHPSGTAREQVEALHATGFSEREIFEATVFVAFRRAFCTVNGALGARPDRQLANESPAAILSSVTYGRAVDGE